jgi:hypothetical protein
MQKELKDALSGALRRFTSRETIALVVGGLSLLEQQASSELWAIFSLVALTILRGAKVLESYTNTKQPDTTKTEKVASIKDTQDTPTEKPEF